MADRSNAALFDVSVLFSEPKIPQSQANSSRGARRDRFSALQRAENSSIAGTDGIAWAGWRSFSALQRAENSSIGSLVGDLMDGLGFSALQRAENSSMGCPACGIRVFYGFSALQRAENSSIQANP